MIRMVLVTTDGVVLDAARFEARPDASALAQWLWGVDERRDPETDEPLDPMLGDERGTVREAPDGQPIGAGWRFDGKAFSPPVAVAPRVLDAMGFRDLFTDAERIAIRKADDRLADAELMAMAQNSVNLDSPRTAQLMDLAVAKGAISRARANDVLAGRLPQ